jgi:hypothetical protein
MKAPSPDPHLARTPGQLEKFPESFIEEMDDILIQPEWFNAWEGYFKKELPVGTEYERLIRTTMAELKDRVVPQLIGQWLFVLGNACKQARLKQMKDWPEFVKACHVLIAKLILSDAYALFTHHEKEDRIFLEGLAVWAGHDYSSAKGQDIAYWAETYQAKGDHSGRPDLSPVVQQDLSGLARAARAQGAGADSGLFDQMHGEGEVSLCSPAAHCQNPAERGRGQVEAVH